MIIQVQHQLTIGKTRITIMIEGCVDCGALESIGAEDAVRHMFQMGDRKYGLTLKRCADCAEQRGAKWPAEIRSQPAVSNQRSGRIAATV